MIDRGGHHSVLALPALPSPLHFLAGVLAWDALSWSERLSVLRIGRMIKPASAFAGAPSGQLRRDRLGLSVRAWLEKHGQAPRLCELLWEPLALAALNQSIDQAEASHFIGVLERVFGPDPASAALVLPAVPLDELYARAGARVARTAWQRSARQRAGESGCRGPGVFAAFACATK